MKSDTKDADAVTGKNIIDQYTEGLQSRLDRLTGK